MHSGKSELLITTCCCAFIPITRYDLLAGWWYKYRFTKPSARAFQLDNEKNEQPSLPNPLQAYLLVAAS